MLLNSKYALLLSSNSNLEDRFKERGLYICLDGVLVASLHGFVLHLPVLFPWCFGGIRVTVVEFIKVPPPLPTLFYV